MVVVLDGKSYQQGWALYLLTWTCVGITNWVDHVSDGGTPGSCASSLETFTQSFLYRAWPKIRSPEIGSKSAWFVVAHVFSWLPARLRHVRGVMGRKSPWSAHLRGVLEHDQTSGAFLHEQCQHTCKVEAATQFHECQIRANWSWLCNVSSYVAEDILDRLFKVFFYIALGNETLERDISQIRGNSS